MKNIRDCKIHPTAKIMDFVNLYECEIGEGVFVGPFVEIQRGVKIGKGTRISSHSFLCEGVEIGEHCFVGHGVMFTNDLFDSPYPDDGKYTQRPTRIGDYVRIGSNVTILPVNIGNHAVIGASAVITRDIEASTVWKGHPAHKICSIEEFLNHSSSKRSRL
ncbi:MAG: N-acetyltransferase [Deltaproteobacteria bacterium]|nr:N-acetyltransferase [Deltaproteobacteria bacterium]